MNDENPIAKLGDLTKSATVLIEKISDAVGGVFKPYQIVRVKSRGQALRFTLAILNVDCKDVFYTFSDSKQNVKILDVTPFLTVKGLIYALRNRC